MTLSLWKCRDCGFMFGDGVELGELIDLYEGLSDTEYVDSQETRRLQMRWLLGAAREVSPEAVSLLDIGAGTGILVAEAKRLGLDAVGVEPSRALAESAHRDNAAEVLPGVFPHPLLEGRKFDMIFLVDVIEHVSNPVELLQNCAQALHRRGLLVIVTPDVASIPAKILGWRWWHFRLAHIGYFDRRSLRKAIEAAGLSIIRQFRAKWFFPIGYLAERLAVYLPIGWLNRLSQRLQPLRWLYERVIPLNLSDSLVVFTRHSQRRSSA